MAYRRTQETRVEETLKHNSVNFKIAQRAKWENVTDGKIVNRRKADRVAQIQAGMAANLEGRRRSLTALYNDEMASWTAEINDIGDSPGERKEALRARATALRDAREKDRREFVESCYQKQWRDQCDDARTLDSKAMMKFVSSDRKVQESQKLDVKAQAAVDEAAYVDEWRVRMDELEKLELAKESMRKQMDGEVKGILDQQIDDLVARKEQLALQREDDAKLEMDEWRAAQAAEAAELDTRKQISYARGREVREYNDLRLGMRAEVKEEARQNDLVLLRYALLKEQQDDEKEAAKRANEKLMSKRYQEYLAAQMVKEKEDNTTVDALRLQLENRIWDEKDKDEANKTAARAFLMGQVDAGRKAQIEDKGVREADEQLEGHREVAEYNAANAAVNQLEDEKAEQLRKMRLANQSGVVTQKVYKGKTDAREKQLEFLASKALVKHEKDHVDTLDEQAGEVRLYRPLKHTNWYT